jgi:chromosome segregation ATPase
MTQKELREKAKRLGVEIAKSDTILQALEKARGSLEGARAQISMVVDEMRMQTTISKERIAWCIAELDKLRADIEDALPPAPHV